MQCPKCGVQAKSEGAQTVTEDGKGYIILSMVCRNRKCGNYGKVIGERKVRNADGDINSDK